MISAPLAAAVDAALAAPEGRPLAARFAVPAITALVTSAAEPAAVLEGVLGRLIHALAAAGVPRGRQFVLLVPERDPAAAAALVAPLRHALGVPVLVHTPGGATFRAGALAEGTPLHVDDELREAEALVLVGRTEHAPWLLWPGVAGPEARAMWQHVRASAGDATALALAASAETQVPADLVLWWDDPARVHAGGFAALVAHATARLAPHRDAR